MSHIVDNNYTYTIQKNTSTRHVGRMAAAGVAASSPLSVRQWQQRSPLVIVWLLLVSANDGGRSSYKPPPTQRQATVRFVFFTLVSHTTVLMYFAAGR